MFEDISNSQSICSLQAICFEHLPYVRRHKGRCAEEANSRNLALMFGIARASSELSEIPRLDCPSGDRHFHQIGSKRTAFNADNLRKWQEEPEEEMYHVC